MAVVALLQCKGVRVAGANGLGPRERPRCCDGICGEPSSHCEAFGDRDGICMCIRARVDVADDSI